jgi:hypothetical protein
MNTFRPLLDCCVAVCLRLVTSAPAQISASADNRTDQPGELVLKERGAHHKSFDREIVEVGPRGEVRRRVVSAYTELASGLHYWEDGQWKETEEVI